MSPKAIPGILSFLLPGLGHVYLGNTIRGLVLFTAFILPLVVWNIRWLAVLIAIYAGWEAYRLGEKSLNSKEPSSSPKEKLTKEVLLFRFRKISFSMVGVFGFFFWMVPMVPLWNPLHTQVSINRDVGKLAREIRLCKKEKGIYPSLLENCPSIKDSESILADPWGNAYRYQINERGFEILSKGKDGELGTKDDFKYRYR